MVVGSLQKSGQTWFQRGVPNINIENNKKCQLRKGVALVSWSGANAFLSREPSFILVFAVCWPDFDFQHSFAGHGKSKVYFLVYPCPHRLLNWLWLSARQPTSQARHARTELWQKLVCIPDFVFHAIDHGFGFQHGRDLYDSIQQVKLVMERHIQSIKNTFVFFLWKFWHWFEMGTKDFVRNLMGK